MNSMTTANESAIHAYAHAACDCSAHENQVCDICQGISKAWRKHVIPAGPWRVQWYGSGEDRGYHIKEGRETIAFLRADVDSEAVQDIVWAHNVSAAYAVAREEELIALAKEWHETSDGWMDELNMTGSQEARSKVDTYAFCARQILALIGPKHD